MIYLFDLDGTLVYSKIFIREIYINAYDKADIDICMFKEKLDYLNSHTLNQYLEYLNVDPKEVKDVARKLSENKKALFNSFKDMLIPNIELIEFINANSKISYIVSNASQQTALSYKQLLEINIAPERIYSRERLKKPKPSKYAYESVIIDSNLDITNVVVYEDSLEGLEAARSAGIRAINKVIFCTKSNKWSVETWK